MKRVIPGALIAAALFSSSFALQARTIENFNSRKGIPSNQLRASLQNQCWSFHHFDINNHGWNPGIEGDGAMVATPDALNFSNSGLFTPLLKVDQDLHLSFDYTFNTRFSGSDRRWLKICLADASNEIVQVLEKIEFEAGTAVRKHRYSTTFSNLTPGQYRLVLQYGGKGGSARLAIDQLDASASIANPGGCSLAPVANALSITGMPNRTASGFLIGGVPSSSLSVYIVNPSPDGAVVIGKSGAFSFEPNKGFTGSSTRFSYRVCEDGSANLCSENAIVHVSFPITPIATTTSLVDFKSSYRNHGDVELVWTTGRQAPAARFHIERSLDGYKWVNAGIMPASGAGEYAFTDNLSKSIAHKKDLYYRIRQVNRDGLSATSRMLIARVYNTRTLTMISVTPNPAKNDIAVNVQLLENSFVSMRVINGDGIPVIFETAAGARGDNSFLVSGTSKLNPGPYTLEVIVNSKDHMLVKLIKE